MNPTSCGPTRHVESSYRHSPYTATDRHVTRRELSSIAGRDSESSSHRELPAVGYSSINQTVHDPLLCALKQDSNPTTPPPSSAWSSLSAMFGYKTWDDAESSHRTAGTNVLAQHVPSQADHVSHMSTTEPDVYVGTPPLSPSSSTSLSSLEDFPTTPASWDNCITPEVEALQEITPYSLPSTSSTLSSYSWTTKEPLSSFITSNTTTCAPLGTPQSYCSLAFHPLSSSSSSSFPAPCPTTTSSSLPSFHTSIPSATPIHRTPSSSCYTSIPSSTRKWGRLQTPDFMGSARIPSLSSSPASSRSTSLSSAEDIPTAAWYSRNTVGEGLPWGGYEYSAPSSDPSSGAFSLANIDISKIAAAATTAANDINHVHHSSATQARLGENIISISGPPRIQPSRSPCHSKAVEPAKACKPRKTQRTGTSAVASSGQGNNAGTPKKKAGRPPQPYAVRITPATDYNKKHRKPNRDVGGLDFINFYRGPKNL
ncbi:hypothetical protein D9613_011223 [Agrocybe pediades]|uniref:Uncharacterized protein n=1 Tax=Agrocybe pediades TaxID=84607 RepID=A0A8H4QSQ3_9AGAR|nr:hypothetical protein D9613_011223 [Agrocybe pediades]